MPWRSLPYRNTGENGDIRAVGKKCVVSSQKTVSLAPNKRPLTVPRVKISEVTLPGDQQMKKKFDNRVQRNISRQSMHTSSSSSLTVSTAEGKNSSDKKFNQKGNGEVKMEEEKEGHSEKKVEEQILDERNGNDEELDAGAKVIEIKTEIIEKDNAEKNFNHAEYDKTGSVDVQDGNAEINSSDNHQDKATVDDKKEDEDVEKDCMKDKGNGEYNDEDKETASKDQEKSDKLGNDEECTS